MEFLVAQHLLMSTVAQREDITNPEVVERFASKVGNKERLDGLYLLTVCDIRATSPKVWNAWKYQLLTDLYHSTLLCLEAGGEPKTRAGIFDEHRKQACELIAQTGMTDDVRDAFWKELNIVYFLRHSPQDIAWHTVELAGCSHSLVPVVKCRPRRKGNVCKVLVYTHDQKDLLPALWLFSREKGSRF